MGQGARESEHTEGRVRGEGPLTHRQPEEGAQEENGQKTRRGQAAGSCASQPEQDKSC